MVNSVVLSKSLLAAINMCIDTRLNSYYFINLATITKVNNNFTINAKPLGKQKVKTLAGITTYKPFPQIYQIPYLMLNYPVVNDYCILLHLDKYPDNGTKNIISGVLDTLGTPIKYIKGTSKPHSLNNCVAICGFKNIAEDIAFTSTDEQRVKHSMYEIGNILYPLGSIYMNIDNTNPETLFGGKWEAITDVVLAGAGTTNINYPGTSGGEKEHTHTVTPAAGTGGPGTGNALEATITTSSSSNIPPYMTVYMWKRTELATVV